MNRLALRVSVLAAVLALPLCCVVAQVPAAAPDEQILGTWRLVSYIGEDSETHERADVMGPHPCGYINYGRDGRMIVIIVAGERTKPAGSMATPSEAQALLKTLLAYAGTYTLDIKAHTVTHHIDVSWDETRTGQAHVRTYRFEGDRLMLTTQPSRDPGTGRQTTRTLVWERVKSP